MHIDGSVARPPAALIAGVSIMLPNVLEAQQCTEQLVNSPDHGLVQQITCCGTSACCSTQWKENTLVFQTCS
jgi:hypothetical protein